MFKIFSYPQLCLLIAFIGMFCLQSCVVTKKSIYFSDVPDTVKYREIVPAEYVETVIQEDDILSISIQTIDPLTTAPVNQATVLPSGGNQNAGQQVVNGFLVDKNGNVSISMLGTIKVAGLTTFQARSLIQEKAANYFKNPTVQVRFANYKITVIGEVARPASYTVPNEKVTLLDALGLAGDLTIFGRRENVLLIRDNSGTKEMIRFNLNSSEIFKSPYFYLKQNDVIYVEPSKAKVASTNASRTQAFALAGSVISVVIVLLSRF